MNFILTINAIKIDWEMINNPRDKGCLILIINMYLKKKNEIINLFIINPNIIMIFLYFGIFYLKLKILCFITSKFFKTWKLMLRLNFFFFWFIYIIYFLNFFSFLNSLIILESLSLLIFFFFVYIFFNFISLRIIIFYFCFIVCERAIGLSILVKIVKFFGSVNFSVISFSRF